MLLLAPTIFALFLSLSSPGIPQGQRETPTLDKALQSAPAHPGRHENGRCDGKEKPGEVRPSAAV